MRNQTWKTFALALLIGPALLITGCKGGEKSSEKRSDKTGDVVAAEPVALAEPIGVLGQQAGDSKALAFGVLHIQTQEQYDALGDATIYPDVDFAENDLVIVSLGERNTGGYAVKITGVQLVGTELAVTGKATTPAADAVTTQALTYPYDAVVIPNTKAETVVPHID